MVGLIEVDLEYEERREIILGLPKVELHRHVEGAMRPSTLLDLGRRRNLNLPLTSLDSLLPVISWSEGEPRNLAHFLTKFHAEWYQNYADVERIVAEAVEDAAAEGIVHLELRFSPEHFCRNSTMDQLAVIEAFCERGAQAAEDFGISVRFLLTFTRERFDPEQWTRCVDHGASLSEQGIVGVDLAGDEFKHPNRNFQKIFQRVKDTGTLSTTIHAGEGTPARQVSSAIEVLGADRIGHGVTSIQDQAVMDLLMANKVTLEMCPISNYQTGCIDDFGEHPLPKLHQAGVLVSLNSDDPTIHRSSLVDDYLVAVEHCGLTHDDLLAVELNSVAGSFLNQDERALLADRVKAGYQAQASRGLA